METLEKRLGTDADRRSRAGGERPGGGPYGLRLAAEPADVERALALERAAGARLDPSRAPWCDFLLLTDGAGALAGVCRLLPHPARDFSRFPEAARRGYAPVFTALRYAGLGVLEVGSPVVAGSGAAEVCRSLWEGILHYMDRQALSFAIGWETAAPPAGSAGKDQADRFLEDHGLFLESAPGGRLRRRGAPQVRMGDSGAAIPSWSPAGLCEALRRGARLAGEPLRHAGGELEFLWVAARNVLE